MGRTIHVRPITNSKGCVMTFIDCDRQRRGAPGSMPRASLRTLAAALVVCGLMAASSSSAVWAAGASPLSAANYSTRHVCPTASTGRAACLAQVLVPRSAAAKAHDTPLGASALKRTGQPAGTPVQEGYFGFRPADLHSAYALPAEAEGAQTIALVDAYDDPTAEEDLRVYDEEFGLPQCTTANGCFRKLNQEGRGAPLPEPEPGWGLEISLDIQTAHSICQNCHIMLIEANSSSLSDLETAEDAAVGQGATEVSNSFGAPGYYETGAFDHPGVVITASSGDSGTQEPASYPASSPNVVAVGGTSLTTDEGRWSQETAWYLGGSGCNWFAEAPSWQLSLPNWSEVGCGADRTVVDVSAVADPYTGAAVYDSSGWEGWLTVGGTSLSSPLIAATYALAGGAHGVAYPAATLYSHLGGPGLHDITEGSDGWCEERLVCGTGVGYDGATGVGTPNGLSAFIPQPLTLTAVSPSSGSVAGGTVVTLSGTNLGSARAVEFGGTPASITDENASSISVLSPAHPAGKVAVTVTAADGTKSSDSSAGGFVYVAPEVPGPPDPPAHNPGGATGSVGGGTTGGPGTNSGSGSNSGSGGGGSGAHAELRLSGVRLSPTVLRHGRRAVLRLDTSEAATVIVTIRRVLRGHAAVRRMTLQLTTGVGTSSLPLSLANLGAGRYVVAVTATAGGTTRTVSVPLMIRAARRGR